MIISNLRPGAADGRILARFDIDFENTGIRMYGVELRRNSAGEMRAFAPSLKDRRLATFTPALNNSIINELGGLIPDGATAQAV